MAEARTLVRLEVPAVDAELAADALWVRAPSAVSQEDLPNGYVRLTADIQDAEGWSERWPLTVLEVDGPEPLDAWREWAQPHRAGRNVLLQPAWLDPAPAEPGEVVVILDPGHSFGSGSHPSTRLCVAALEMTIAGGESVLDLGSGSGVLSVVALRLGAASAVGVDTDPGAAEVAMANARSNGVDDRFRSLTGVVEAVRGTFEVAVANIGVRVLSEVAASLERRVRPGGHIVLAGLLADQVDAVVERYEATEVARLAEDDWAAVVLRRPTG